MGTVRRACGRAQPRRGGGMSERPMDAAEPSPIPEWCESTRGSAMGASANVIMPEPSASGAEA